MKILTAKKILAANDRIAEDVRARLNAGGVYAVSVLGAPGAGKTALLEALLPLLKTRLPVAVIEGDQATARDADRIAALGVRAVQVNTGGGCHLSASMVAAALAELDLVAVRLLFIENVGNLICPAQADIGEHLRLAVLSVAEGDDKVAKYPTMFGSVDAVALNKADLLPYLEYDMGRLNSDLKRFGRKVRTFRISAKTGVGIPPLAEWLLARAVRWSANTSK
jgi:hydrogenase nickel incorporation protein HypB